MWWLISAAVACDEVIEVGPFLDDLDAAFELAAAGTGDEKTRSAVLALEPELGCLSSPLSPVQAARLHLLQAVKLEHEGDARGASAAVAASRRLAPDQADSWLAPLETLADLDVVAARSDETFATSLAARVYVDGTDTVSRPQGLPVLVQIISPSGEPLAGGWVHARDPLPSWVAFPPADCPEEVSASALVEAVDRAGTAYAELDVEGFERALHTVASGIPCLDDRVGLPQAAAIHRLEGIRLFTRGAEGAAVRSFQQAHALMPGFSPPASLIPPQSTLSDLWDLAGRAAPSPWLLVEVPDDMRMAVDGLEASQRPVASPAIVQVQTPSGKVLLSRYVPPGAPLPDLEPLVQTSREAELERLSPAMQLYRREGEMRRTRWRRLAVGAAGSAALVVSGALYIDNAFATQEYKDPETPWTRLRDLERRARTSATASAILFITGTGTLTASAFVR